MSENLKVPCGVETDPNPILSSFSGTSSGAWDPEIRDAFLLLYGLGFTADDYARAEAAMYPARTASDIPE